MTCRIPVVRYCRPVRPRIHVPDDPDDFGRMGRVGRWTGRAPEPHPLSSGLPGPEAARGAIASTVTSG
jgi:hypothetical protein